MTAPLTDNEIQTTRERAGMRRKYIGTLSNGEAFYSDGRGEYSVERDHWFLAEPTAEELKEIDRFFFPYHNTHFESDGLAPAREIFIGLMIVAVCYGMARLLDALGIYP